MVEPFFFVSISYIQNQISLNVEPFYGVAASVQLLRDFVLLKLVQQVCQVWRCCMLSS